LFVIIHIDIVDLYTLNNNKFMCGGISCLFTSVG